MTTFNHTPISNADPRGNDAEIWNGPMRSLDEALGNLQALSTTNKASMVAAANELRNLMLGAIAAATVDSEVVTARGAESVLLDRFNVNEAGIYNVRSATYGATADGATSDTAAIQAAVDAAVANGGGIVYLPRGTYIIDAPIEIDNLVRPLIIQGQMADGDNVEYGTVIKTTTAGVMFLFTHASGFGRDVYFRDLGFLNTGAINRTTLAATAITNQVTLNYTGLSGTFAVGEKIRMASTNTYATILADTGSALTVTNTTGQFLGSQTITGQTSSASATISGSPTGNTVARIGVENCRFKGLTYGIKLNFGYADGLTITDCVFETVFRCIYGQSIEASIIDKCVAEPFTDYFLQVRYPKSCKVSNCLIRGTSQASLRCVPFIFRGQAGDSSVYQYGDAVHISDCHIEDVNAFAYLLDTPRATIRNCWFGLNGVVASDHIFTIAVTAGGVHPTNILLENLFFGYVNSGSVDSSKYMIYAPPSGTIDAIEQSLTAGATTVHGLRIMGWWPDHPDAGGTDYNFHPTNNRWYAYNQGYELITNRLRMQGSAAPTAGGRPDAVGGGNFVVGDIVFHNARNGNTVPVGWSCITGGSPGTWVDFGNDRAGSTANRPTAGLIGGFQYYDTTLDQIIYRKGDNTTWVDANGAPLTTQTYTVSNVSTDRGYDANATTLDELADVLGTLIADLRAKKIIA